MPSPVNFSPWLSKKACNHKHSLAAFKDFFNKYCTYVGALKNIQMISGSPAHLLLLHQVLSLSFEFLLHEDCLWYTLRRRKGLQLICHPMNLEVELSLQIGQAH